MSPESLTALPVVGRIGWTLIHFIFQGIVIAIALALALRLARKAGPQARYSMALGALALMVVAPAATFCVIHPAATTPSTLRQIGRDLTEFVETVQSYRTVEVDIAAGTSPDEALPIREPGTLGWRERLVQRTQPALPWMVLAWLLGVTALSARHITAWGTAQQYRRRWVKPVAGRWEATVECLSGRLGVRRAVRLLESAVVEVPSLIGWLKPVILLPASALSGLTPAQIESIIAHELAHVRRHDYLVNVLQTVVETLLFYHPAVWWVSRRARNEREMCCDELVVDTLGNARVYAMALTRMEELRTESSEYAIALTGGTLMKRIRRLIGMQDGETGAARWLAGMLTVALLGIAVGWMVVMGQPQAAAVGEMDAGIGQEVKSHAGYVDFQSLDLPTDREPTAEIMLNKTLLGIATSALRESNKDVAGLIDGIDLHLVHVLVYEDLQKADTERLLPGTKTLIDRMMKKGWYPIVRVPEDNVTILLREGEERILGFALVVLDDDQLVLVNVVGDVDAAVLGQRIGSLLNKTVTGEVDLEQWLPMLGKQMMNSGMVSSKEPTLVYDDFETSLEIEKMTLTDAVKADDPGLGEAKAIRFETLQSRAVGSISLEPGIYKARVYMLRPDGEHDAVTLTVGNAPSTRVFRNTDGLGPTNQSVQFSVKESGDVLLRLDASETGMLLDRVEIKRYRNPNPAPESKAEVKSGEKPEPKPKPDQSV
ncbi:DUF4252 domain-containing protein [Candidatus Sumerlaeota bacterium]|nr:DUF4252 domain-containing protein [Candidatus Sumerlaeota bacterium]